MADLLIPRKPYGSLWLENASEVALDFFANDVSSVDAGFEISFDDRAAQAPELDAFIETDVRVLQRGMRLARTPRATWEWLKSDAAPWDTLEAIPHEADLIECSDEEWGEVRALIQNAVAAFISENPRDMRSTAVATKVLHLRRPRLIAVCDGNVLGVLGIHLPIDKPTHDQKVSACLEACDLIRAGGRANQEEVQAIQDTLAEQGRHRPKGRILDALLWQAY